MKLQSFTPAWPSGRVAMWCVPPALVIVLVWLGLGGTAWDVRVPVAFSGDALFYLAQSKATLDHGWWWSNPAIGAPIGYHALVFAQNTNIDQTIVWLVGRFTREVAPAVNLAWIGMLALSAVTTTWGMRRLGVSRLGAGAAGVLFALSPFAFYRNVSHFNLVTYLVPFPATAAVLLASAARDRVWHWKDLAIPLAGCLLLGFDYIYYAFFGSILIATGMLIGFGRTRSLPVLKAGALCLGTIVVATALNLVPNQLAWRQYGRPRDVDHRAMESEVYGLKIRHLVSPVMNHGFPPFQAWLKQETSAEFPFDNENTYARLGAIAAAGWLALMAALIVPAGSGPDPEGDPVPATARLSVAAVLLATVGGFGSVFSLLLSPEIRAYNRVSPFLTFFALAAVAFWIDRLTRTRPSHVRTVIWVGMVTIGLLDQRAALADLATDEPIIESGFHHIQAFVSDLEARLPDGAMVFQLPMRPYPVDAGIEGMRTYDQFRPYLTSHHLRWSYPVLTRQQVRWEYGVAALPAAAWPAHLATAGFSAILINRAGYADSGFGIAATLGEGPGGATAFAMNDDFIALDLRPLEGRSQPAGGAVHP